MADKNWHYASIGYPESLPEDWLDRLKDLHIRAFVSPLHDKDVADNGEFKKPHYHIMLMYDNTTTFQRATKDFESFGVTTLVKSVRSKRGMARYLCHLDDKDKAQYNIEDVISIAGADYPSCIETEEAKTGGLVSIFDFIDDNNLTSFAVLLRYLRKEEPHLFELLLKNSATVISIKEYLRDVERENKRYGR